MILCGQVGHRRQRAARRRGRGAAGRPGSAGHIEVGDGAQVAAKSAAYDIGAPPARRSPASRRSRSARGGASRRCVGRLEEIRRRLRALERRLGTARGAPAIADGEEEAIERRPHWDSALDHVGAAAPLSVPAGRPRARARAEASGSSRSRTSPSTRSSSSATSPGQPVVPGVLLIEAMAQAGGILLAARRPGPRAASCSTSRSHRARAVPPAGGARRPGALEVEVLRLRATARQARGQGAGRRRGRRRGGAALDHRADGRGAPSAE